MKQKISFLAVILVSVLTFSCMDKTCTSGYLVHLKVDGKKGEKVLIEYIGPKKENYEKQFGFYPSEHSLPYFQRRDAMTNCYSKDFKKQNYDFLKIQNLGSEEIIICGVPEGAEVDDLPNYLRNKCLLEIYGNQDKDPNYDYTKDKQFDGVKLDYVDRNTFYEQLINANYPYIIKLKPQKSCIMKWNNLGFKAL